MKTVKDFNVNNLILLVRCDFNVPLDNQGNILDDFRIQKALPTLKYLLKKKAKIVLLSHLGKPEGKVVEKLRMDKVAEKVQNLIGVKVEKLKDCIGLEVKNKIFSMKKSQILMLENLRFHKEETDNNISFAKELAQLGQIYINDAFGDCHRLDASIVSVPKFLPSGIGLLMENEIKNLKKVIKKLNRPFLVIIGGTKTQTKIKFIEKISFLADKIIINGPLKNEIIRQKISFSYPEKIIGPAVNLKAKDISKKDIKIFTQFIKKAKSIVWNGPFGACEDSSFENGTLAIAKAIINSGAFSVVGGGETVEFLNQKGILKDFDYVSTGGGSMLMFLTGDNLPGIEVLK